MAKRIQIDKIPVHGIELLPDNSDPAVRVRQNWLPDFLTKPFEGMTMGSKLTQWLIDRLKEGSSWAALAVLGTFFGLAPADVDIFIQFLVGAAGLAGFFLKDKGATPAPAPAPAG